MPTTLPCPESPKRASQFPSESLVTLAAILLAVISLTTAFAQESAAGKDDKLIAVLKSAASPKEKDAACAELKRVGTERAIPALAALLTDAKLSHSARYVLESMASPAAGKALSDALDHTSGEVRIGIIGSLGMRGEKASASKLIKLLEKSDVATQCAAVAALGRIDSKAADKAVRKALATENPALRAAAADACLEIAARALANGRTNDARALYEAVLKQSPSRHVTIAAHAGLFRASKLPADSLIAALKGSDETTKLAALLVLPELSAPALTKAVAASLPAYSADVQVAVIQSFGISGATDAAREVARQLASPNSEVQMAAIVALGNIGGPTQVEVLAEAAATLKGPAKAAARDSLANLRHGDATPKLLALLERGNPAVQAEVARALGNRRSKSAVPQLLQLAGSSDESAARAALQALPPLVNDSQLSDLVQLVAKSRSETIRSATVEALNAAYQTLQTRNGKVDPRSLVNGLSTGPKDAQLALLPVCSGLTNADVREALRASARASDAEIRAAALLAICDSADPQLLPDVTTLACEEKEQKLRTAATQAAVRLATQEEAVKLSPAERTTILKRIAAASPDIAQTKMLLAGFAEIATGESFEAVRAQMEHPEVRAEAQQAAIKIAGRLTGPDAKAVLPQLKEIGEKAVSPDVAKKAEEIVAAVETAADYITNWDYAGPYQSKGKDYSIIFDIPFDAEKQIKSVPVKWHPLPPPAADKPAYIMDLLSVMSGEQRAAYARTVIESPVEQRARLEIGSDDGVKAWLNSTQVLANNIARPLTPGSDRVDVTLRPGRNDLLLKITQNNQGWEFCARLVQTNGAHLEGLKIVSADHVKTAAR